MTFALRTIGSIALFSLVSGCAAPRRATQAGHAYGQYAPYGQYQQGQYGQQGQTPGATAPAPQVAVGSAFTAFGPLMNQLPKIAFPLPPLPGQQGGGTAGGLPVPWQNGQFPFPFPLPGPQPQPQPSTEGWPAQWTAWEDDVLARTNATRARGVVCGGQSMPPAPPVGPNTALRSSARGHSKDMADRNYFDHSSPEGTGPSQRAQAAGFSSTFVGENIAAGQTDPARVIQAWIDSPGHCVNMMDPRYRVLGVGYFFESGNDRFAHYWTQNFGG